ncbi:MULTISPECIES: galactokinase [unclassified Maribacter]|uniref:galactokinase n=1 Tax=unclassified Maribacter TaxID=2615042 RepID=UPI000EDDE3A4|nr:MULTISPECIES: galactokinase [unclassified Maribacter]HAI42292.1 galactokinase [Maribacter sp.]|tara:strand:+ start:104568 stop:105725 length:1158 start_codon:yes stop_codon:yes gene_type:complete
MIHHKVKSYFEDNYIKNPILIKAPGRINLIGEHTDYNQGLVLPASIEKGIYFAVSGNKENNIQIESFLTQPEKIVFQLNGEHKVFESFWGNYFKAIIEILIARDYPLKGMNCVFGGDIPIGSGLSSSAALCCGFIYAITQVSEKEISREDIALIAQEAEHKIGLNCGLMDQYAVLFGKKGNAFFLDCNDLSHKYIPINLDGYSWVLINSNIKHNLAVDSEYNKRRVSCENIVKQVQAYRPQVKSLRDISKDDLVKVKNKVNEIDIQRAKYIIEENERVLQMMQELTAGDAIAVGNVLKDGHWAMSTEYEITTTELDHLVKIGEELDGVLGSRMMGGGFGGCTINLIETKSLNESIKALLRSYKNKTGIDAEYYHLAIDDGVKVFE